MENEMIYLKLTCEILKSPEARILRIASGSTSCRSRRIGIMAASLQIIRISAPLYPSVAAARISGIDTQSSTSIERRHSLNSSSLAEISGSGI